MCIVEGLEHDISKAQATRLAAAIEGQDSESIMNMLSRRWPPSSDEAEPTEICRDISDAQRQNITRCSSGGGIYVCGLLSY